MIGSVVRPSDCPPVNPPVSASISFFTQKLKIFFFLPSFSSSSPPTAKPTTKSTTVSVRPPDSRPARRRRGGGGAARAKCCCLERPAAAAAAVLGSRLLVGGGGGGEARRQQTLGLGFGREKGFKQRRNSYFKQKIEWRELRFDQTDGLTERSKQKTGEEKSGRKAKHVAAVKTNDNEP